MQEKTENGLREAAGMLRKRLYDVVGYPVSGSTTCVPVSGDIDIAISPGDMSLADASEGHDDSLAGAKAAPDGRAGQGGIR